MEEIWKDIEGYEGMYQISSMGRCRALERTVYSKIRDMHLTYKPCMIVGSISNVGYRCYSLGKDGKMRTFTAHRLVAKAFIENTDERLNQVNHKDMDRLNNRYDNLEWVNNRENNSHSKRAKSKSSKYVGVSFKKNEGKWAAGIKIKNKSYALGLFDDEEKARERYIEELKARNLTNRYA